MEYTRDKNIAEKMDDIVKGIAFELGLIKERDIVTTTNLYYKVAKQYNFKYDKFRYFINKIRMDKNWYAPLQDKNKLMDLLHDLQFKADQSDYESMDEFILSAFIKYTTACAKGCNPYGSELEPEEEYIKNEYSNFLESKIGEYTLVEI